MTIAPQIPDVPPPAAGPTGPPPLDGEHGDGGVIDHAVAEPVFVLSPDDRGRLRSRDVEVSRSRHRRTMAELAPSTDLAALVPPGLVTDLDRSRIGDRRAQVKAPNTVAGYAASWRRWCAWCAGRGASPLPAHPDLMPVYQQALAAYLAEADDTITGDGTPQYAESTLESWSAAIGYHFGQAGLPHPARSAIVAETMTGIRRRRAKDGVGPAKAAPLMADMLVRIAGSIDSGAKGWKAKVAARRDIALLVLGYAAGLRRSELVALWIGDVYRAGDTEDLYLLVRIRGSKRSPEAMEYVPVRRGEHALTCPWCALLRWLQVLAVFDRAVATTSRDPAAAGEQAIVRAFNNGTVPADVHVCDRDWPSFRRKTEVALFRPLDRDGLPHDTAMTDRSVPNIVKRRAAQAGLDPAEVEQFSGHSLRSGAATQALVNRASLYEVARLLRHADMRSTRAYDLRVPYAGDTAADRLGL
ncbi:tyrosine-type recombinase/integrase [Nocardia tengchongensis]|uniref:tyrosine-type recombinase/integrase n=1 Tax=Nocardia tengchongensis TaxID=2055889 RepID=UPI0036BE3A28